MTEACAFAKLPTCGVSPVMRSPTFAPFGQYVSGRSGLTRSTISDAVIPGAFFGVTFMMAALIASYFSPSAFVVRPGTLMLEISTFATHESAWNSLDAVNQSP